MERKLSPVGFNAFAIIGLLVILPFSTAVLTNLAGSSDDKEFEDIVMDGTNYVGNGAGVSGGTLHSNWIDIGGNFSTQYKAADATIIDSDLECFHLIPENAFYSLDPEYDINVSQCDAYGTMITPYLYSLGYTNYNYDGRNYLSMGKTHDFIPGGGYIGTSGNNFAFSVEQSIFDNIRRDKDIGGFQVKMLDDSTIYSCDNAPNYNLTFDYSITFVAKTTILDSTHYQTIDYYDWNTMKIDGFEFDDNNVYDTNNVDAYFDWASFQIVDESECVLGIDLDFNFDGLQSLDISDFISRNGNNISNISAIIEITNMDSPDVNSQGIGFIPLPFTGNGEYKVSYGAKYMSATQTNFFLKGGALLIGVGLFALAIASTPYWDPFANFFKGRI